MDDQPLVYIRRDISGGINTRESGTNVTDTQVINLVNADIGTPGQVTKRPGNDSIATLSATAQTIAPFQPISGTNQIVAAYSTNVATSTGGSFTDRKTNFTATTAPALIQGGESGEGDVLFVGNGTDNWFRMNQSYTFQDLGNTNTSPPIGNVGTYYRSRLWILKSNLLYWSDAYDDDYSGAFDRTANNFNMPVGTEMAILGLREEGLICFGSNRVYGINPSAVPAATDKPELLYERGCIAGRTVVQAGDDVYFMSQDGIRGLFRSQQDKLQVGSSNPVSYNIKDQWDSLSWAYITKACAVYFDNKIFFSVPVNASTTNNQVWVYYPATKGWVVISGWNVSSFAKVTISGQEKLYGTDSVSGKVYQLWTANDDDGTAIAYTEESRKDDLGQPLVTKYGGYLKIRMYSAGSYTVNVFASVDDAGYIRLGDITTPGSGTALPLTLPFTLTSSGVTEASFPLDDLGPWKYIQIKLTHPDINTDEIKILERNLLTYGDEYTP